MTARKTPLRLNPKDEPFTAIPNRVFTDQSLSFAARGLLGYLLSRPPNWEVYPRDVQNVGGVGRDKAYSLLNECIAAGYIERVEERAQGRITGYHYIVSRAPKRPAEAVQPVAEEPVAVAQDGEENAASVESVSGADSSLTAQPLPAKPDSKKEGLSLRTEKEESPPPTPSLWSGVSPSRGEGADPTETGGVDLAIRAGQQAQPTAPPSPTPAPTPTPLSPPPSPTVPALVGEVLPPAKPPAKGARDRRVATYLPADYVPDIAVAIGMGLDEDAAIAEAEHFLDHWRASATANARKADWPATWRNWCRRAVKERSPRPGHIRSALRHHMGQQILNEARHDAAAAAGRLPDPADPNGPLGAGRFGDWYTRKTSPTGYAPDDGSAPSS